MVWPRCGCDLSALLSAEYSAAVAGPTLAHRLQEASASKARSKRNKNSEGKMANTPKAIKSAKSLEKGKKLEKKETLKSIRPMMRVQ